MTYLQKAGVEIFRGISEKKQSSHGLNRSIDYGMLFQQTFAPLPRTVDSMGYMIEPDRRIPETVPESFPIKLREYLQGLY
jgi:hypothetical protein